MKTGACEKGHQRDGNSYRDYETGRWRCLTCRAYAKENGNARQRRYRARHGREPENPETARDRLRRWRAQKRTAPRERLSAGEHHVQRAADTAEPAQ